MPKMSETTDSKFYIYALVSTTSKVKSNYLRVDRLRLWLYPDNHEQSMKNIKARIEELGEDIDYIGISRNVPTQRLSQHHGKPQFIKAIGKERTKKLAMHIFDSGIKSEWHALRDEANYISNYFDQYGHPPLLQGAANSGKYD